MVASSHLYCRT